MLKLAADHLCNNLANYFWADKTRELQVVSGLRGSACDKCYGEDYP
jgi:hypothetical protein